MGTATLRPEVSGDDGHWLGSGLYGANELAFGLDVWGFVRLPSSPIPAGATILSAVPKFVAYGPSGAGFAATCVFAAQDNPAVPTTAQAAQQLPHTSDVSWAPAGAWSSGVVYAGPDLSGPLQEVVSRAGYAAGNAVMLLILGGSGSSPGSWTATATPAAPRSRRASLAMCASTTRLNTA